MSDAQFTMDESGSGTTYRLTGRLVTETLDQVERAFAAVKHGAEPLSIDLSGLDTLDTGGAFMIANLKKRLAADGLTLEVKGARPADAQLLRTVEGAIFETEDDVPPRLTITDRIAAIGERVSQTGKELLSLSDFLGITVSRFLRTLVRPRRLRVTALFAQMDQVGYAAVPIVALMGFLIGIVLAYQGAAQLRQFGAEVFVVDLIAVAVLRELGILLTAIIIAGRSGSAFAASIGSMKVNEEIDAMRTLGLDPIEVLVLPRLIALVVMLPVLGFVANIFALLGGALMSWIELDVSPSLFAARFWENTDVWHLIVGMVKAPVFAFIIAIVACWQGFQVAGSAESVGQRTTASVVQSIFLVIVMDAVFSVFFVVLGV